MGESVSITQAKAQFSRLLKRVRAGEGITITKAGKPIATLSSIEGWSNDRIPGMDEGKVVIHDDFDDPMPEVERHF